MLTAIIISEGNVTDFFFIWFLKLYKDMQSPILEALEKELSLIHLK